MTPSQDAGFGAFLLGFLVGFGFWAAIAEGAAALWRRRQR